MKLSIIVPVLNSHEIVRRNILHYECIGIPDDVEIIYVDDGSDPPIESDFVRIHRTNDIRPWTWALARNAGAKIAKGKYLLMTDLDYIISKGAIEDALKFDGDYMGFRREFGILDENGKFSQDYETLKQYGLTQARINERGTKLPPHPNNFVIRKDLFFDMGGYREDLLGKGYPAGEDNHFKKERHRWVKAGKLVESDYRPTLFMFPNGKWCGDVDQNPFDLFHTLSRKTKRNPFHKVPAKPRTFKADLSVCIAAREEEFLKRTIDDVLENSTSNTEVIAVLDGYWPNPAIPDNPRVTIVHHTEPIGQRAAINEAVRISQAKFVMKLDAHCSVARGFDTQLINDCKRRNWTLIPEMWNLHILDWKCKVCGKEYYQADRPKTCCDVEDFEKVIVWKPRRRRNTFSWRFDKDMHFQYWRGYKGRPQTNGKIIETMSCIGCCWFIHREQYWKQEGLDEAHGSWGQVGSEVACKAWLSGGRLLTDRNTWMAHCFRTKSKFWKFPYQISGNDQERAREYSKDLWLNDKWSKAKYPLSWLVDRFKPVPGWDDAR